MMIATTCTPISTRLQGDLKVVEELYNLRQEMARLREQNDELRKEMAQTDEQKLVEQYYHEATMESSVQDYLKIRRLEQTIADQRALIDDLEYQIDDQRMQIHELLCHSNGMMIR